MKNARKERFAASPQERPDWRKLLISAVKEPGLSHQCYRLFWRYSAGNQLLALIQCLGRGIQPGPIASFHRWKELGRYVKKGERAISLLMPVTLKGKSDESEEQEGDGECRTIFVLRKNWFVLSQTDGDPYEAEPIPDWDRDRALTILEIGQEPFHELNGNMQGYATEQAISVSPLAALPHKTRFHEIAHVLLGHTAKGRLTDIERIPKSIIEAEAESVALICCESLGLPGAEFSRSYIQGWLDGEDIPERSAQRIFAAADRILKAGLPLEANERRPYGARA